MTSALEATTEIVLALAGNPNTGKSTVFNALTGMNQHTGNWAGKTVGSAVGHFQEEGSAFQLVDLPGTYSLLANSADERVARDFLASGQAQATIIVTDATCLERNLNLALQVLEITDRAVVVVNLMDEAERKGIRVDIDRLSRELGVPVIPMVARSGKGLPELKKTIRQIALGDLRPVPKPVPYGDRVESALAATLATHDGMRAASAAALSPTAPADAADARVRASASLPPRYLALRELEERDDDGTLRDEIVSSIYARTEQITAACVRATPDNKQLDFDRRLDDILTSPWLGFPAMLLMLGAVFYLTIAGANIPSGLLADFFGWIEGYLTALFTWLGTPAWVHGVLVLGLYRGVTWVTAVMLPPMAIFFPIFAILEDFGYLPRVAFNLDRFFKGAGAHGKQALTMTMGFGCNAAGVVACRIIESPRERIIAIITNNFVPCNGRWPTLILLSTLFLGGAVTAGGAGGTLAATGVVVLLVLIGIATTLFVSWALSKTLLRGVPSHFTLELPPYRQPQIGRLLIRSVYDRTAFVLKRALVVAAPAGVITWILANIIIGDQSILAHAAGFLDPFARSIGLDGYILMAFLLGMPANEIVLPILIMSYLSTGAMTEMDSLSELKNLFLAQGWTWVTALCMMLFSLLHYPCGTTMWTIAKETKSAKWTLLAIFLPTSIALGVCFLVAQTARYFL